MAPGAHDHSNGDGGKPSQPQTSMLGRYKVYKAGTKRLIDWLVATAGRCGDLMATLTSLGILSAKVLRQGKSGTPIPTCELNTQDLLKLAQTILAADPPVEVPDSVLHVLNDVIAGRQECANWYAAQALKNDGQVEKQNESHAYFITVLQHILDLLKQARTRRPSIPNSTLPDSKTKTSKRKAQRTTTDVISNLFTHLQLEEPSEHCDESPRHATLQDNPSALPSVHFKLQDEDSDSGFQVWCWLQDLDDVRTFVRNTWLEYSKEFETSGPLQSTDWSDLIHYLGLTFFTRGTTVWMCPRSRSTTSLRMPNSDLNITELLCPIAVICLQSYGKDAGEYCHAECERMRGKKKVPEPKTSGMHHFHDICCAFWKLAPQLHAVAHAEARKHFIVDEFVQGLADVHATDKFPMWTVVACQIYLDVYDLLGDQIGHGVEALEHAFQSHKQITIHIKSFLTTESAYKTNEVDYALDMLCWFSNAADRFEESFQLPVEGPHELPSNKQIRIRQELGCAASTLERSLPAHAGAILTELKIGLHKVGIDLANYAFYIVSMAHLYKALRAMGVLHSDWHDMDFLIAASGPRRPIVPKLNGRYDRDASLRSFYAAICVPLQGASASDVITKAASKNARVLEMTSLLLRSVSSRQDNWQDHGFGYSKSKTIEIALHALTASASGGSKENSTRGPSQLRETFTPLQMLSTYKRSLIGDEPLLNFDFATFMTACARMFSRISESLNSTISDTNDQPSNRNHCSLVAMLLTMPASHPAIVGTATVMQSHIGENGKQFLKQAYDQSSGRIPKDARPKILLNLEEMNANRETMTEMLDYSGTKCTFSGRAMAAYHPRVKPELCTGDCCHGKSGGVDGGDTEPRDRNFVYGSAIPDCILEEGTANMKKDPSKYIAVRNRLLERKFADFQAGSLSEEDLIRTLQDVLGIGLIEETLEGGERLG